MPHSVYTRNLGRSRSFRKATVRSLAQAVIEQERILTTLARAKEAQRLVERLITLGKSGTLANRRRAVSLLNSQTLVARLFQDISPRFATRPGGYTRIVHYGFRRGDAASMAVLELVELSPTLTNPKTQGKGKVKTKEGKTPGFKAKESSRPKASETPGDVSPGGKVSLRTGTQPAPKTSEKPPAEKPKVEKPKADRPKPDRRDEPRDKPKGLMEGFRKFFKGRGGRDKT